MKFELDDKLVATLKDCYHYNNGDKLCSYCMTDLSNEVIRQLKKETETFYVTDEESSCVVRNRNGAVAVASFYASINNYRELAQAMADKLNANERPRRSIKS